MGEKERLKGITGFEQQETVGVSPWMLSVLDELGSARKDPHWTYTFDDFSFEIIEGTQSLWIVTRFPAGGQVAFRTAYCPDGKLEIDEIQKVETGVEILISSTMGGFRTRLEFPRPDRPMLHYKTTINPVAPLAIPFWPRDVISLGKQENITDSEGVIYTKQVGPRSGLVYFSLTRPKGGSVFYFQNLTSLNDYCQHTETSLSDTVGGEWPELGFALPASPANVIEPGAVGTDMQSEYSPAEQREKIEKMEMLRAEDIAAYSILLPSPNAAMWSHYKSAPTGYMI